MDKIRKMMVKELKHEIACNAVCSANEQRTWLKGYSDGYNDTKDTDQHSPIYGMGYRSGALASLTS